MHDGGVILFAKHLGNRVISDIRIILAKIHDHLSGDNNFAVLLLGHDRGRLDAVVVAYNAHDPVRSNYIILFRVDHILESFLGIFSSDLYIIKSGISSDLLDGSLKLTDIGFNIGSNVFENLIVHIEVGVFHILSQDGHSGLVTRRLDISDQAPLETGAESLVQGLHFLGRTV